MPERPLVSVITAFYNAGPFLQEAIAGVLAQTYSNWEYWLVNDGSSDGSDRVARDAAAVHPDRIHYLEHPNGENRGVCTSRNLGLQHARGEYIAILDADDVWFPNKLTEQVTLAQEHSQAGLLFGRSEYWYSWSGDPHDLGRDEVPPLAPGDRIYGPGELLAASYPLGRFGAPCPTSVLVKTSLLRELGGFEQRLDRNHYEDQAFLAKLYLSTHIYVSSRCWDRYRIHNSSACAEASNAGREQKMRREYLNWLRDYLDSHQVSDPKIWVAWNRATLRYRHPIAFLVVNAADKFKRKFTAIVGSTK